MSLKTPVLAPLGLLVTLAGWAQSPPAQDANVPMYRVTVVERTVRAVNYQYRSGPTQIDFRGTVLMPSAKGEAVVESKSGRTEIDAKFDRVDAPARFGSEYLTYVLWAITPDGHAKNLGEVLTSSSDKGRMRVTTDLQSFGLIVTAEPYAAVRLPSDVVVMENVVRPDTLGTTEPINIKYELMPRGAYTYNVPADLHPGGPKVSMDRYETLVELYQAQNALQIAQSQGADQYAPEIFSRAQKQYEHARQLDTAKAGRNPVISAAREAAETAEDARMVAAQRRRDQELTKARDEAASERQRRIQAEAAAHQAQAQATAQPAALRQSEAMADAATGAPAPPPPLTEPATAPSSAGSSFVAQPAPGSANRANLSDEGRQKLDLRLSLLHELNGALEARDTPRGLTITVPDADFSGGSLNSAVSPALARIASTIQAHPGLTVEVDGNTDAAGNQAEGAAYVRAEAVVAALVRSGLPANLVSARSLGSTRPVASNATASGRDQNRRVEIVISGSPIGTMPYWDKPYSLNPK